MSKIKIVFIIVIVLIISLAIGVGIGFFYEGYNQGGALVERVSKITNTIEAGEKDLTVSIVDLSDNNIVESTLGERVLRSDFDNIIFQKIGFYPLIPRELPENLIWGDVGFSRGVGLLNIDVGNKAINKTDFQDIEIPLIMIFEQDFDKLSEAELTDYNQLISTKKEIVNGIELSGKSNEKGDRHMIWFLFNGNILIKLVALPQSNLTLDEAFNIFKSMLNK